MPRTLPEDRYRAEKLRRPGSGMPGIGAGEASPPGSDPMPRAHIAQGLPAASGRQTTPAERTFSRCGRRWRAEPGRLQRVGSRAGHRTAPGWCDCPLRRTRRSRSHWSRRPATSRRGLGFPGLRAHPSPLEAGSPAKPDPLLGGFSRLHGYLAMSEDLIFLHLPW